VSGLWMRWLRSRMVKLRGRSTEQIIAWRGPGANDFPGAKDRIPKAFQVSWEPTRVRPGIIDL
jgi:hypothetical protein